MAWYFNGKLMADENSVSFVLIQRVVLWYFIVELWLRINSQRLLNVSIPVTFNMSVLL